MKELPEESADAMAVRKAEVLGSDAIENYLGLYSAYLLSNQFPNAIDGFKRIYRRVLWTVDRTGKWEKIRTLSTTVMGKLHPHGDSAIDAVVASCTQPFVHLIPWLEADGGIGTYDGKAAAAGRYLEVRISDFAKDVLFTGVNTKTFSFIPSEFAEGEMEPAYFIPKIPTALLVGTGCIGFGFKADVMQTSLNDLCLLGQHFIEVRKKFPGIHLTRLNMPKTAKLLFPEFATPVLALNTRELLKEYENRNFSATLRLTGVLEMSPETITVRNLVPGAKVDKTYLKMVQLVQEKNNFVSDNFRFFQRGTRKKFA